MHRPTSSSRSGLGDRRLEHRRKQARAIPIPRPSRLGLAQGEPQFDALQSKLAAFPVITVPTVTLEGDANGAPRPDPAAYAKKFSGWYRHRTLDGGIGHNLPQEAPAAFADAIIAIDRA